MRRRGVGPRRNAISSVLLGAGLGLAVPPEADAQECGTGAAVTCTSDDNPYADGISYNNPAGQSVTLEAGVVVNSGANRGVELTASTGNQSVTIAPGVTITTTGAGADGVIIDNGSFGTQGTATVDAGGSVVSTEGDAAYGFGLSAFFAIDATVGDVTVSGDGSVGVWARSLLGTVNVTTTGDILAEGSNTVIGSTPLAVNGIFAQSLSGDSTSAVTVDALAGSVTLTGATTSHAITATNTNGAVGGGGSITVTTADVSTVSNNAFAIHATTTGTGDNGIVTVDTTAGTIGTAGSSAQGIHARSGAGGSVVVRADGISTEGASSIGIFAQTGTPTVGDGSIDITTGDIGTLGAAAHGIQAESTGTIEIDSTAGTITTEGTGARGITVDKKGTGAITIDAGAIATTGDDGQGIHVISGEFSVGNGGAVTITANSVSTTGDTTTMPFQPLGFGADAISVFTVGAGADGKVVIDTSVGVEPDTLGSVSTAGDRAAGIRVESGRPGIGGPIGGGAIEITAGDVSTEGDSAAAISAQTEGSGEHGAITINVLGTISTKGEIAENPFGPPPSGINAVSWGGGNVSVTARDVFTEGGFAAGIFAQSGNGPLVSGGPPQVLGASVTIDTTGGTVSTKGAASSGIGVGSTSGTVMITAGDVITEGSFANAISAGNSGPDSDMTIDTTGGTITTKGQNAHGVVAGTGSFLLGTSNAGLLTIHAGDISTEGQGSNVIAASANNGAIDIDVIGALATDGNGSTAISVMAGGTTTNTITVNGTITTTGDISHGIVAAGSPGTNINTITVNGTIVAQGPNSMGIQITGTDDSVMVSADGSVSATGVAVQVQQNAGAAKVTNAGTITGTGGTAVRFMGEFASTFDNDGTVNGNVLLGAGADTAILGTSSAITGNINGEDGSDTLRLAGTGTNSIDAATILNFEAGEKIGSGTWTLTGTNAAFASTFDVNAGTLLMNGTLANTAFAVNNGGLLGGDGTLASFLANSGGVVAPGNSIGTLHVNGDATFSSNSTFRVEIAAANEVSDHLDVGGSAAIDPAANLQVLRQIGVYTAGLEWHILHAEGGVTGTFADEVLQAAPALDLMVDYRGTDDIWLVLLSDAAIGVLDIAETPNQIATAEGVEDAGGALLTAFTGLDEEEARAALDNLSGEAHATVTGIAFDSPWFREGLLARLREAQGEGRPSIPAALAFAPAPETAATGWNVWAVRPDGYLASGRRDGDGNAAAARIGTGGFMMGADRTAGDVTLGFAGGFQRDSMTVAGRGSTADIDTYNVGVYGGWRHNGWTLRGGAVAAHHGFDTARRITVPGLEAMAHADYSGWSGQVFGEAGREFAFGATVVEPYAGLRYVHLERKGFSETGAGPAGLTAGSETVASVFSRLGVNVSTTIAGERGRTFRPHAGIAWEHAFSDMTPSADFTFPGGGDAFHILGPVRGRDTVRVHAGLDVAVSERATAFIAYQGSLASDATDQAVRAGATLQF